MNTLKVALCQINVIDNKEANIKEAETYITIAHDKGAELAVLPEMFNCPYENSKFVEYAEVAEESHTLKHIQNLAEKLGIYILAGSIPEKVIEENGNVKIYNTSFFYDNKGKLIGKHRKMHLFDIDVKSLDVKGKIRFKESDTLTAGDDFTVVDTKWGKIGLGICYDIRFPELARILTLKGADILIYPGAFNLTTGPSHWETLFKTRALDNQVYTIGVSPALNQEGFYNAYGHSIICDPWGDVIVEAKYDEKLITETIDLDLIKQTRQQLPVLKNRRNDLYRLRAKRE